MAHRSRKSATRARVTTGWPPAPRLDVPVGNYCNCLKTGFNTLLGKGFLCEKDDANTNICVIDNKTKKRQS